MQQFSSLSDNETSSKITMRVFIGSMNFVAYALRQENKTYICILHIGADVL